MAERLAATVWRGGHRCALIDATPMRPGHGRRSNPTKGRRLESRRALHLFECHVQAIAYGLESDSLSPEAARQEIREAGLESFVRIAETREEAVEALAVFYGEGYYLADVEEAEDLLHIRFCTRKQLT